MCKTCQPNSHYMLCAVCLEHNLDRKKKLSKCDDCALRRAREVFGHHFRANRVVEVIEFGEKRLCVVRSMLGVLAVERPRVFHAALR
mmetsp:Transcript_4844/g.12988  ORF Transcript_4844/g.12988 Transcript_4844/m.12988 type:complete len:87 (-) Transcript_4844:1810-2070(-)